MGIVFSVLAFVSNPVSNMLNDLSIKATHEAAHKKFWMQSHTSQASHYSFPDHDCEGTAGNTELKNWFSTTLRNVRSG
jgi:hypothetical protein